MYSEEDLIPRRKLYVESGQIVSGMARISVAEKL